MFAFMHMYAPPSEITLFRKIVFKGMIGAFTGFAPV